MRTGTRGWIRIGAVVLAFLLLAAAWKWTPLRSWIDPERLTELFEPLRSSWLALPVVVLVFVLAELVLFPVLVLIFACGLAFGPWLGTLLAFAGAMTSAIPPFYIGRWLGRGRVEHWGGRYVQRALRVLDRRGVMAVFLVRKIPAPYSLANLLCGACGVSLREFLLGTLLGMGTGIVLITVPSGQLLEIWRDPEPAQVALALGLFLVPVVAALYVQRWVNRRVEDPA